MPNRFEDLSPESNELPEGIHPGMIEDIQIQIAVGSAYLLGKGGVRQDLEEAVKWFEKAAAKGNPTALYNLGVSYCAGTGVPRDLQKAAEYFQLAADKGDVGAQFNLGIMYKHGEGVATDTAKAYRLFEQAAAQGEANAQYEVGVAYERGRDLPPDRDKTVELLRAAAEQGHALAQGMLGILCAEDGNMTQAIQWFDKASHRGEALSQRSLGQIYLHGYKDIPKNPILSYVYLALAAAADDLVARRALVLLVNQMSGDQIFQAEEQIKQFQLDPWQQTEVK